SDAIYGPCERYVSRQRLESMLRYEQDLTRERLTPERGDSTRFFTFADTVSARNFRGTNECHAWMGIQFQAEPRTQDNRIIVHVRMLDDNNAAQQEALGIVGVNLVFAAYELHRRPDALVASLTESLSAGRVEIDMIDLSGPAFDGVDNRIMSLRLVQLGLTGAAMFSASGQVLQPSEVLRKRALLVQRGRFRPVTHVNIDLLESARRRFQDVEGVNADAILPIMEISMHNLMEDSQMCLEDFVSRAEVASATGCTVMVSDFREYHRLAAYLARYTREPIGMAMGLGTLRSLFEEQYYGDLDGGILEGFGRLFKEQVKLLVYPLKNRNDGKIEELDSLEIGNSLQHLFSYLRERQCLLPLEKISHSYLDIHSPDVLGMIARGDAAWVTMVPDRVAAKIKEQNLFGYGNGAGN
ncbi:MAG: TonB-dependent receptor, partial [Gammaproteobacteria bacterium]|nr:TonB-dependent receptor [Gammaproteobacteria bacterium]